ncbi:MAG: hypothetical protein ACTSRI_06385 [Promethearchaeota archaeon]
MSSGDFASILEESFKKELSWLELEFDILFFNKKGKYTKLDKKIAKEIFNSVKKNKFFFQNEKLSNLLELTLSNIQRKYPDFF